MTGKERRRLQSNTILMITPTVLTIPRGDATNERETIACLERNFSTSVLALRKIHDHAGTKTDFRFSQETRLIYFPFLDVPGFRLLQVIAYCALSWLVLFAMSFSQKPKAIIVTHPIAGSLVALIAQLLKIPIMYRVHSVPMLSEETPLTGNKLGAVIRIFDITAINSSDVIQVATEQAQRRLSSHPTVLIPYSVNPDFYNCVPTPHDSFTVGFLGNISLTRDFKEYLLAIKQLTHEIKKIKAVFVGEGLKKQQVVTLSKQLGLDNVVEILPLVPHTEVPRLLSKFDVIVNPQLPENQALSTKLIEAMAAGVPVVTTVPHRRLLENKTTCLVVQNKAESYEEAISLLYHDVELRTKLIHNARRTAETFFARSVVAELYRKAIESLI